MTSPADQASLDQWYPIGAKFDLSIGCTSDRLLSTDLVVTCTSERVVSVQDSSGRALPMLERFGLIWTSLGTPPAGLFLLPEADEPDRRVVGCGSVLLRASGLRIIENFLDMAHFPFVHTDVLGAEPYTEVRHYDAEIRRNDDEVWATNCQFYQPQAAASAKDGIVTDYAYRVMTPFATVLYKTCPNAADRQDVICLFVQPMDEDRCRAHPIMFIIDDESSDAELVQFQQMIFLQDRIILENQRPVLLPLGPRAEMPTRADACSSAYRRWLKEKGVTFGALVGA